MLAAMRQLLKLLKASPLVPPSWFVYCCLVLHRVAFPYRKFMHERPGAWRKTVPAHQ